MATSLALLQEHITEIPVSYNGHTINVGIATEKLDADLLDAMSAAEKSSDSASMRLLVSKVVARWDLYMEEENDFPVTPENIGRCPLLFLTTLVKTIFEVSLGNAK